MGMREWVRDRSLREPVSGVLRVTALDFISGTGYFLTGVVSGAGVEPTPVQRVVDPPRSKMLALHRHLDLPVVVDRADPRRLRIRWDEVPDARRLELMDAARLADQMRAAEAVARGLADGGRGNGASRPDAGEAARRTAG